jgi:hypothetical protein
MKKNCQLHLFLESDLLERLRQEADNNQLSISELCRQKLREYSGLIKIELMLENLLENRKMS